MKNKSIIRVVKDHKVWVAYLPSRELLICKNKDVCDKVNLKNPFVKFEKIMIDKKSYDLLPAEACLEKLK